MRLGVPVLAFSLLCAPAVWANETQMEMDDKDERPKVLYQELKARHGAELLRAQQVSFHVCTQLNRLVTKYNVVCAVKMVNLKRKNKAAAAFENCRGKKCIAKTGRAVGAPYAVLGDLAYDGKQKVLTLYLFDIQKGKYAGRSRKTARDIERLVKTIPDAIDELDL